ncbi:MAG: ATP/GTP-binding protein [marine bacterium B5-7]|nr:MAG: ATP/GTP-binding protein [marine bacterium B5-7]
MITRSFKNTLILLVFSFSFINTAFADGHELEQIWEVSGFASPESVVYDPVLNHLYVSNVNGGPLDKDGNGYISIVSMDGRIINEKWVTGLDGPMGLALSGRTLYTADIDALVAIDVNHGRITDRYKVEDPKFMNDLAAAPNGDIYMSDMLANRIYLLSGNTFSIWIESDELEAPNGLDVVGDDLILGAWGVMTDGFATAVPGHLKRISIKDKSITSIGDGSAVGNMDGVEVDKDGGFYVTDWMNGKLFHISSTGDVKELLSLKQGTADLEFIIEKDLMFIPMMNDNIMYAYKIKR